MTEIEALISKMEAYVTYTKEEYHISLKDYQKGYYIERAKGAFDGAKEQLKIVKEWYNEIKRINLPKEVNYLDNNKIEYIYESKLNYER